MIPNLARYLNKTILVSIPALFDDPVCRPCTLLGAEINGLWLQSDELTQRLLPSESADLARLQPVVFVPFAQMGGVLVATAVPQQPPPAPAATCPSPAEPKHEKPGEGQPKKGPKKH
jgi:hypothetical protein